MFSANAAGCVRKIESLMDNIKHTDAAVVTLQETHFKKKGKLNDKLPDYQIFEAIRKKQKGGTLIAIHKALDPILIEEYSSDFELVVVEAKLGGREVWIISGYGPQENWKVEDRMPFFVKLEEEISKAKLHGKEIIIQMDANSKLGPTVIMGDPHKQSDNGRILAEIVERNSLVVMNGDAKCKGIITRRRITKKTKEESVIDLVIVSDNIAQVIEEVKIDEERKYVLTKYTKTKNGIKITESDHHSIITRINAKWKRKSNCERKEIYNLKDEACLATFKEYTSKDKFLSEVFEDESKCVEVKSKQFIKRLKFCLGKCFRKIRIKGTKRNMHLEQLFEKRRILRTKRDEISVASLKEIDQELAELCAKENMKIINEACKGLSCENGGVNGRKMWQLKKRLKGIVSEPPAAMIDEKGNIVTSNAALENLILKQYEERLKTLEMKHELKVHKVQREKLCDERLENAQRTKTPEWTIEQLDIVLKQLKSNKSRDPIGLTNELFKTNNIGSDLKKAVLALMNQIKTQQKVPQNFKLCNITSLYKNKGSRKEFDNYRGIFRVTALRSILDKLIYNDEYPTIDKNLTDSNVGARQKRNIRDNIFVVNSILNDVMKKKIEGIDIQIFDIAKCFDKLWAKECLNDLYENGFVNDKLPLLYHENVDAQIAVKTASGITRRTNISDIVMQGTVWGSLMCTSTMDNLGKEAYSQPDILYNYKGVEIPPLGMVDDIISVTSVENTAKVNQLVNTFVERKKLRLAKDKCHRIHIGKGHEKCPELTVHEHKMADSDKEKYLGDYIHKSGKVQETVNHRKTKGRGVVSEILSILDEIPLGKHRIEVGLKLREAMFLNGILFNSEVWHGVTNAQITSLEALDNSLLRGILGAHKGTPKAFLYLETGTMPLRWIIAQRRINYLKHILTRNEEELIKKVFNAQKERPTKGDFVTLVETDLKKLGMTYQEVASETMTPKMLKTALKNNAKSAALGELLQDISKSTKAQNLKYNKLEIQDYLKSDKFSREEASMLTALRSKCVKGIRADFKNMEKCIHCPLKCEENNPPEDTHEHLLICTRLSRSEVPLEFIHGSTVEQSLISTSMTELMRERTRILEKKDESSQCCLPGALLDQCSFNQGAATV